MAATSNIVIAFFIVCFVQFPQARSSDRNCSVLYLLNVQPYPDAGVFSGFDGGLSLIPAARLAAEQIHNRSDILTGLRLEVIDIDAEACGRSIITKGLVNLYRELLSRECVVGVIGFPCSTSTNVLAPIIGHPSIGYITLANSVTPEHRNITEYPNLFHSISSSSVHNRAILSLMRMFNWKKIGLVFNSESVFHRSTAIDFERRIGDLPFTKLTTNIAITNDSSLINDAFDTINTKEARISYWLGNDGQYAYFLCEAYRRKFLWPGYVYILRYNPNIISDVLKANTSCSDDELILAMERVFMLDYRSFVDNNTELFSRWNYSQFRRRYVDRLNEFANEIDMNLTELTYANSFYDQVWTFALAINNSLPSLYSQNLSFSDYTLMNTKTISNIIKQELLKLSFQGASGQIKLDENHEIPSFVDIFQIQHGKVQSIAIFDPFSMNITPNINFPDEYPQDTFDTDYNTLPLWLGGCILVAQGLLFVLITTNLVLMLLWRKEKEIKAISPLLSILMMIGCYSLCAAPVFLVVYRTFSVKYVVVVEVMCYLKTWSTLGFELILATLFLKILRIYHIFHTKNMITMSQYWLDKYICMYALLICLGRVFLLIVWNIQSPIEADYSTKYIPGGTAILPHYMVTVHCKTSTEWSIVSLLYTGVLLFMVVVLAIETRHIKNNLYKDTKKVNIFIFLAVIFLFNTIALLYIFPIIGIEDGADISEWLAYFSVPVLCQVCLFLPKTLPLAVRYVQYPKRVT